MWLGNEKGKLQDWITQEWVKITGRKFTAGQYPWLQGPIGSTDVISDKFVHLLALKSNLTLVENGVDFGLLNSIDDLGLSEEQQRRLNPKVAKFYTETINYEFEAWSKWANVFRPFGTIINRIFSKRLQQLNLPLDPMDVSQGMKSNVWKLVDTENQVHHTIWYRILKSNQDVIYSGVYNTVQLPGLKSRCMKVSFPLPNGNATVIMKIQVEDNGSLLLLSEGQKFGDPGFYFLLKHPRKELYWSRYIKAMHESIRVFEDAEGVLRTDHLLNLHGKRFLDLHYKINPKT